MNIHNAPYDNSNCSKASASMTVISDPGAWYDGAQTRQHRPDWSMEPRNEVWRPRPVALVIGLSFTVGCVVASWVLCAS